MDDTGAIYAGDVDERDRVHLNPPKTKKRKAKGPPNRKVADRTGLHERLHDWLASAHASDPLRAVRPATFILDPRGIKALSAVHSTRMVSIAQVVLTLHETEEWGSKWGHKVFSVISSYDAELERNFAAAAIRHAPIQTVKTSKAREIDDGGGDQEWQPRRKRVRTDAPLAEVSNVRRSTRLALK